MSLIAYKKNILDKIPESIPEKYFEGYFNSFINSFSELSDLISNSDNILDVGCGPGLLVNYLSLKRYKVEGFDNYLYNPHTKEINDAINSKDKVKDCDINEFQTTKKFDVIFLHNVIEHLDDWKSSMEILNNKLNSNGKLVLLLPNYSFPLECHFMLPIVINKHLTYSLFQKKINSFELKHERSGMWDSLNFVKPRQISNYYLNKGYSVKFDKTYFPNFLFRLIENLNTDSVHKNNFIHKSLVALAKISCQIKLVNIFRFMPLIFHPFIKIIVKKT